MVIIGIMSLSWPGNALLYSLRQKNKATTSKSEERSLRLHHLMQEVLHVKRQVVFVKHTWLSHWRLCDGRYSAGRGRSDRPPMGRRNRPRSPRGSWRAPWTSHPPEHPFQSRKQSTKTPGLQREQSPNMLTLTTNKVWSEFSQNLLSSCLQTEWHTWKHQQKHHLLCGGKMLGQSHEISCNCLSPGWLDTEGGNEVELWCWDPEKQKDEYISLEWDEKLIRATSFYSEIIHKWEDLKTADDAPRSGGGHVWSQCTETKVRPSVRNCSSQQENQGAVEDKSRPQPLTAQLEGLT